MLKKDPGHTRFSCMLLLMLEREIDLMMEETRGASQRKVEDGVEDGVEEEDVKYTVE